jgi:secreted PhoX family phosphatase
MTAGHIYTIAGNGTLGFSGDGGPATSAELSNPSGVTIDSAGNVIIADEFNERVRVVAAGAGSFYGVPMTAGHIYTIAGNGTQGYAGDGGPATSAKLSLPSAVAVDGSGNLVIADRLNARIRVVAASTGTFYGIPMTAGDIYTVAGNGTLGGKGDGGPATSAELVDPSSVAITSTGNLVIADQDNENENISRVRIVQG